MSDVNEIPPTPESNGPVCSTASNVLSACLFRLAMYAPVALIMSGLAALAMYPELADYGYPLTGNPSHTGFTGERPCQSDRACAAGSLHSNYPLLPVEDSSCSSPSCTSQPNTTMNSGCCPSSRILASSRTTAEGGQNDFTTDAKPLTETPAVANSAVNVIESGGVLESDGGSN